MSAREVATYRYLCADLLTGAPLADLPLTEATVEEELNEPGALSASLPMFSVRPADIPAVRRATQPGRTTVTVISDGGQVLWDGIIWKRRLQDHTLGLEAAGILSYYARTRILTDLVFSGVDQLDIARALFAHAHGKTGGDIGVDLGSGASGVLRDRSYLADDRQPIWEAVQELTKSDNAFDVAVRSAVSVDGSIVRTLELGHPHLGRAAGNAELFLDYPGIAATWSWPEEADRMATTVFVRGDLNSATGAAPTGTASDDVLITMGYPRLEEEFTAATGTVTDLTVDQQAAAYLDAYNNPITLPVFDVRSGPGLPGPDPTTYRVGDWFRVRLSDREWFPPTVTGGPGLDVAMRLVGRTVTPGDGGAAATLTFNPYPGSAAVIA